MKKLFQEKELRIYLEDGQNHLTLLQKTNLFWFKKGYLYCFKNSVMGEAGARSLAFLQQNWPIKEIEDEDNLEEVFRDSEEVFCLVDADDWAGIKSDNAVKIKSIYQLGRISVGRARLIAQKLRLFWQQQ